MYSLLMRQIYDSTNSNQKESSHVGGEDAVDKVLLRKIKGAVELMVIERHIS